MDIVDIDMHNGPMSIAVELQEKSNTINLKTFKAKSYETELLEMRSTALIVVSITWIHELSNGKHHYRKFNHQPSSFHNPKPLVACFGYREKRRMEPE